MDFASGRLISILLVEDVPEMAALISHLLEGIPGVRLSGWAKNLQEAAIELDRRRPDGVLLDLVLGLESGLDLLPEFMAANLPVFRLVAASDGGEPYSVERSVEGDSNAEGAWNSGVPGMRGQDNAQEKAPAPWAAILLKPTWEGLEADRGRFRNAFLGAFSDRFRR